MNKVILWLVAIFLVDAGAIAEAQQPKKIPRIGFLTAEALSAISKRKEAFIQGLRELGYVEGNNIVVDWRDAEGKSDHLRELSAELLRLKVDVIVTAGGDATRSAKAASLTIPIVMTQDRDPVANGFIESLARPGGNITGLSRVAPELSGKQLELLKEILPGMSRVAVLHGQRTSSGRSASKSALKEVELAAEALRIKLQYLNVPRPEDIESAFRAARKQRADAILWLVPGPASAVRSDPRLHNWR